MGISDKMRVLTENVQEGVRSGVLQLIHMILRSVTGFFFGLTLGLVAQTLIGFGSLSLFFFVIVSVGLFVRLLANWSIPQILVFDLICVLVAMLFRMYILHAP